MSRAETLQDVIWRLDDFKGMAHIVQEAAYSLTENRERWGLSVEALSKASGIGIDVIQRFESLGAASIGATFKSARVPVTENRPDGAGSKTNPPGLPEQVEHYKSLARLIEEAAYHLNVIPKEWGLYAEALYRASGVNPDLAGRIELIGSMILPELRRKGRDRKSVV